MYFLTAYQFMPGHARSLIPFFSCLSGWHFDAVGVSAFNSFDRFTLHAEDDDGIADMNEVCTVLDNNADTFKRLTLVAYLVHTHSWDSAFGSPTIQHLTHLDLVDTCISDVVLVHIAHACNPVSLTLHGMLSLRPPQPFLAQIICSRTLERAPALSNSPTHMFLPHLKAFRFALAGNNDDLALFNSVVQFLRARPCLR